jgi:hypothetical protein
MLLEARYGKKAAKYVVELAKTTGPTLRHWKSSHYNEEGGSILVTCSRCGDVGHNVRTCQARESMADNGEISELDFLQKDKRKIEEVLEAQE